MAKAEEEEAEKDNENNSTNTAAAAAAAAAASIITPYLSARLAALEAELEAYVPGMTRADLEEKLAKARGEATRGSGWEAVMRRRAAEAAAAAAAAASAGGLGGGAPGAAAAADAAAQPGDDGRFEGPRWLDRAGVGFEYRGGKKKGGGGASSAGAAAANAAHDPSNAADAAPSVLDSDLATFREHQSRAYHEDGRSQRRQRREKR